MSSEALSFLMKLGPANLGVTKARDIMRIKYPDCDYDGPLLQRVLSKGHQMHFGKDPDSMAEFIKLGDQIRDSGGVFKFNLTVDCRISDVFIVKPSMKPYANLYNDFVINDGTHNADKYGLVTMFNTLVDSLGLSIMQSYSQYRAEYSDHLIEAFQLFSLDCPGGTLMTDDGPAYRIVADSLNKKHLLCTKHFHNGIFPAKAGLGHKAHDFETAAFDAIYRDFGSADALTAHLLRSLEEFGKEDAARKFIKSLIKEQSRVCRTHTTYIFSASCKASQRGEGTNSRIKGGGSKKKELREYNLLQLLQWYIHQVELQEEKSLIIIIKLIEGNHKWSNYVQSAWQEQLNQVFISSRTYLLGIRF